MSKLIDLKEFISDNLSQLPVTFRKCTFIDYESTDTSQLGATLRPRFIAIESYQSTKCVPIVYPKHISKCFQHIKNK